MPGVKMGGGPEYLPSWEEPVSHYPVVLDGVVIGHLWAPQDPQGWAAGYLPVVSALDLEPRINALIVWDERFRESSRSGLTPEQALEHWSRADAHPEAGGVPRDAGLETAPSSEALSQAINPGYEDPPLTWGDSGEPIPTMEEIQRDWEWQRWDDFAPVTIGKTYRPVPMSRSGTCLFTLEMS